MNIVKLIKEFEELISIANNIIKYFFDFFSFSLRLT